MGLFSSKKKTYVSSVTYNMAGPEEDRPEYLKSMVLGNILTQSKFSIVDTIRGGYFNGPGIRLRSYLRWSLKKYKQVGVPTDSIKGVTSLNPSQVEGAMRDDFGIEAVTDWIDTGPADITYWGVQWIREHMPELDNGDWRVDYIEATKEGMIVFEDGTPPVRFDVNDFRANGNYIYASYTYPTQQNRWASPLIFIYRIGSGCAALDALVSSTNLGGAYLPFIPIRHEGKFITVSYKPEIFAETKKAYKKAIGGEIEDLIDSVAENESIHEIDFAYVTFGVALNTKDMAARRYLFAFFEHLYNYQAVGPGAINSWVNDEQSNTADRDAWSAWRQALLGQAAGYPPTTASPFRPALAGPPKNVVQIRDSGTSNTNFRMDMGWNSLASNNGIGLGRPGAKPGDVWFAFNGTQEIDLKAYTAAEAEKLQIENVSVVKQLTINTYKVMSFKGLTHQNYIYNGKYVETTASQALVDVDESGFIVPINYEVFKSMPLTDSTQVSTQCCHMVFNCYQIVKKKWYQRGAFKVLLIVVIIVITVVTGGFGAGSVGLLGANAAVGAAIGLTGLAAVIAGAVANMVAAMILTKLITMVSVAVLGEKIGYIVAAIASAVALSVGSTLQSGGSLASSWNALMEPMNLLNMTNAVGNAYTQVINADTMDYVTKAQDAMEEYRKQTLDVQQSFADNIGYGSAMFDPMSLLDAGEGFFTEAPDTFLSRTLLTGSDIAEMTKDMVTNFTKLTLSTEPAI